MESLTFFCRRRLVPDFGPLAEGCEVISKHLAIQLRELGFENKYEKQVTDAERSLWLLGSSVIVADGAGQNPLCILQLPERDELGFADSVAFVAGMAEPMHPDFDCTVTCEAVYLKRARHQRPVHLSANVVVNAIDEQLLTDR